MEKKDISRSPRLDTILMVERFIKEHDGEFKRKKLWQSLPKKMMYQTFLTVLNYLLTSGKIALDHEGTVGWVYYPEDVKKLLKRPELDYDPALTRRLLAKKGIKFP
jgi:hypothetical protein